MSTLATAAMLPYQAANLYSSYKRGPYRKYAKRTFKAMKFGSEFYRHHKKFWERSAKRRKHHFDPENIGSPQGEPVKHHRVEDTSGVFKSTRTLYSTDLTAIPKNTTSNDINKRERQVVFVKGFKVCLEIHNIGSTAMYFNCAVIAPKCATSNSLSVDFFRGSGNERSVDFSTSLTSLDFHCRPINSDRFTILKHKKLLLAKFGNTTNDGGTRTAYTVIDMWVPLNRQIRYEDNTTTASCNPVWLVYWMDKFATPGGSAASSGQVTLGEQSTALFKN